MYKFKLNFVHCTTTVYETMGSYNWPQTALVHICGHSIDHSILGNMLPGNLTTVMNTTLTFKEVTGCLECTLSCIKSTLRHTCLNSYSSFLQWI